MDWATLIEEFKPFCYIYLLKGGFTERELFSVEVAAPQGAIHYHILIVEAARSGMDGCSSRSSWHTAERVSSKNAIGV